MALEHAHERLIETLMEKGIQHPSVLAAMKAVPRDLFVPADLKAAAYQDNPLPIGEGQTISQPFIVAYMTGCVLGEQAHLQRVLEIGTGSGYQAAILAEVADEVYTVERIQSLYDHTTPLLQRLYPDRVHCTLQDGNRGWPEAAPFDGILVTAVAEQVPDALMAQLAEGGRLVIPVQMETLQWLQVITRHGDTFETTTTEPVRFVPLQSGIVKS